MSDLNDPRVLFAAERTLLAWSRTSLTLMGFGFVIERFGLFTHVFLPEKEGQVSQIVSFWVGIAFVLLGAYASGAATLQYRRVVRSLRPVEIPDGYNTHGAEITSLAIAALAVVLSVYLFATR